MIVDFVRYLAAILLVIGSLFSFLAAVGILRLPDLYTRMHAASKAGTVGAGFILLAVAAISLDIGVALRAVVGIGFLALTAPISAHLLARSAYLSGYRPREMLKIDDLSGETTPRRKY